MLNSGLRSSNLLALLSSNESASESELGPASPQTSQELSSATDTSSPPGSTAAVCSPLSPKNEVGNNLSACGCAEVKRTLWILNLIDRFPPQVKDEKAAEPGSPPSAPPDLSIPRSSAEGDKKKLDAQDTLDSGSLSQTPSVSSEDPLSPVVRRRCLDPSQKANHLTVY